MFDKLIYILVCPFINFVVYIYVLSRMYLYMLLYMIYDIFIDVDIRLRLKDYQICGLVFGRDKDLCFSNIIFKYWISFI
jgi:hypothetical protein